MQRKIMDEPWELDKILGHYPEYARCHDDVQKYVIQYKAIDPSTGKKWIDDAIITHQFDDWAHTGGAKFLRSQRYWWKMARKVATAEHRRAGMADPNLTSKWTATTRFIGDGEPFDHVALDWAKYFRDHPEQYPFYYESAEEDEKEADEKEAEDMGLAKDFLLAVRRSRK